MLGEDKFPSLSGPIPLTFAYAQYINGEFPMLSLVLGIVGFLLTLVLVLWAVEYQMEDDDQDC